VHNSLEEEQKELSLLEKEVAKFRGEVGSPKGLTALEKKSRAEELLHKLREDHDGARTVRPARSDNLQNFLRFVLARAEEALQSQRR